MTQQQQRVDEVSSEIFKSLSTPVNEIICGLYLGTLAAAIDESILRKHGITHVLQVFEEKWALFPEMITYHHVVIDDSPGVRIIPYLREACEFISAALDGGGKVLVHCQMGSSRSASFVIAWLMQWSGISYDEALDMVRTCRPCVKPNEGFEKELRSL